MNKLLNWIDKEAYLWLVIVEFGLFYFIYRQFIVASNTVFIFVTVLASLIVVVFYLIRLERKIRRLLKIWFLFLVTFLLFFFFLSYSVSNTVEIKEYRVDITAYYTSRTDGVLFRFKGKAFDKQFPGIVSKKVKQEGQDFFKNYQVVIWAKPMLLGNYKLEEIKLERR